MISVTQEHFDSLIQDSLAKLPEPFKSSLNNVAFVVEDEPNEIQRRKLQLNHHQSLFGLYEGIPLTQRGSGYSMVLPDKITIFKRVIEWSCNTETELVAQVHQTVWHEIAHHFGLGHGRIEEIQRKNAAQP